MICDQISDRIKLQSLLNDMEELKKDRIVIYAKNVAHNKARKFRKLGCLCKAINKTTVKLLK